MNTQDTPYIGAREVPYEFNPGTDPHFVERQGAPLREAIVPAALLLGVSAAATELLVDVASDQSAFGYKGPLGLVAGSLALAFVNGLVDRRQRRARRNA